MNSSQVDQTLTIGVTGMTCQNCVQHVTEALEELGSVKNVSVELVNGGESQVTVITNDAENTDFEPLREAVEDAGYSVTTISA